MKKEKCLFSHCPLKRGHGLEKQCTSLADPDPSLTACIPEGPAGPGPRHGLGSPPPCPREPSSGAPATQAGLHWLPRHLAGASRPGSREKPGDREGSELCPSWLSDGNTPQVLGAQTSVRRGCGGKGVTSGVSKITASVTEKQREMVGGPRAGERSARGGHRRDRAGGGPASEPVPPQGGGGLPRGSWPSAGSGVKEVWREDGSLSPEHSGDLSW